jgi:hypothetical protein
METPLDKPRRENGRKQNTKLIHSNPEGRRKTGRPRKWWVEDVEEDLRKMGIGLVKKSKGEKRMSGHH